MMISPMKKPKWYKKYWAHYSRRIKNRLIILSIITWFYVFYTPTDWNGLKIMIIIYSTILGLFLYKDIVSLCQEIRAKRKFKRLARELFEKLLEEEKKEFEEFFNKDNKEEK